LLCACDERRNNIAKSNGSHKSASVHPDPPIGGSEPAMPRAAAMTKRTDGFGPDPL